MNLNTLQPAPGSKKIAKRVGRGVGSGSGKTCGRGHKGQHARSGGYHKVGFEGGQMPLYRRVPKLGFTSRRSLVSQELRVDELVKLDAEVIDFSTLKKLGAIKVNTKYVKIIGSGEVTKALTIKGIRMTAGARAKIEAAGGRIED